LLWSVKAPSLYSGRSVVADGIVYTGGYDGYLHAFNPPDGRELWKKAGFDVPAAGGGMAFSYCNGHLCRLNPATGAVLWRARSGGWPVALANGVIYTSGGACNAKTGAALSTATGVVANGMVYFSLPGIIGAYGLPQQ
jgi:outer membrane protein assembly factor BamB